MSHDHNRICCPALWMLTIAMLFAWWGTSYAMPDEKTDTPKSAPENEDEKDPFADDPSVGAGNDGESSKKKADEKPEPELKGDALKAHKREVKVLVKDLHKTKSRVEVERKIRRMGTSGKRAERDALIKFATKNKNHEYVKHAFDALAEIGNLAAVQFLCGKDALKHKAFLIAHSAAQALGRTKSWDAAIPLLDVMTSKRTKAEVVSECALAVAKCAPTRKAVIKTLMKYSRHKKDSIRSASLEAIGYLNTDDAVERLKDALFSDKLARARAAAARGLGHTKRKAVIEDLEQSLQSETSQHVKEAASNAIQSIQGGASFGRR